MAFRGARVIPAVQFHVFEPDLSQWVLAEPPILRAPTVPVADDEYQRLLRQFFTRLIPA